MYERSAFGIRLEIVETLGKERGIVPSANLVSEAYRLGRYLARMKVLVEAEKIKVTAYGMLGFLSPALNVTSILFINDYNKTPRHLPMNGSGILTKNCIRWSAI